MLLAMKVLYWNLVHSTQKFLKARMLLAMKVLY
jgi:hypothetical protein